MTPDRNNQTVETVRRLAVHAASTALQQMHHQYQNFATPQYEQFQVAQNSFVGILPVLKRVIFYTIAGSFLIVTSMASYGIFYVAAMPSNAATEQLYFDYTCRGTTSSINSTYRSTCIMNQTFVAGTRDHASRCSPMATVDIFAKHTPWEALHPDVLPYAKSESAILTSKSHYFLEVLLQLPESSINQESGIFTVQVELQSNHGVPLARSTRSARLPHESHWVGTVRKMVCLAPLLLGATTESRTVTVSAFRHFVESDKHPLQHVIVHLVSQGNSWKNQVPVEVIAGELRIGKELNWFQTILKEWFWTSFMIGTLMIFSIQCIFFWTASFLWDAWNDSVQNAVDTGLDTDLGDSPYFFDSTPPQTTAAEHEVADDDSQWEPMVPQEEGSIGLEEPRNEQPTQIPLESEM